MSFEFDILYFLQSLHTPWLDSLMTAVTFLGEVGWFWVSAGVVLAVIKKTRKTGFMILFSIFLGFLVSNVALKNMFERPRPCWIDPSVRLLVHVPSDFSFPSGHATASFAGAMSIYINHKKWGIAALILAAGVGFSRLYLFVHFPSDVLVGTIIGIASALAVSMIVKRVARGGYGAKHDFGN